MLFGGHNEGTERIRISTAQADRDTAGLMRMTR